MAAILETGIDSSDAVKGANDFEKAAAKVVDSTQKITDGAEKGGKSFLTLRDGMTLAFGEAILSNMQRAAEIVGGFAQKTIGLASDFEETQNKFNVVFRGMEDDANDFALVLEKSFAMSNIESRKFLSNTQDLLVPMGMARQQAGAMAFEIVKLSADLGSFNNLPTADVMEDIQSALTGEYESMKKYGVILNETAIKQEALNLGLVTNANNLTGAEKAQAAFSLMTKNSADALGDMERSSGSYANQLKALNANLETMQTRLGQQLLPIATQFVSMLNGWISEQQNVNMVLTGTISAVQFLYNGFKGLELVLQGFVVIAASVFDTVSQKIIQLLNPVSQLFDGLVKLGAMDNNPLLQMQKLTLDFANSAQAGFQKVWRETEVMNQKFDATKMQINQTSIAGDKLTTSQQRLASAASAVTLGLGAESNGMQGLMTAAQIAEAQTNGVTLSAGALEEKASNVASTLSGSTNPAIRENSQVLSEIPSEVSQVQSSYDSLTTTLNNTTSAYTRLNSAASKQSTTFSWGNGTLASTVGNSSSTNNTTGSSTNLFSGMTPTQINRWYRENFSVIGGGYQAATFSGMSWDEYVASQNKSSSRSGTTVNVTQSLSRSDISSIISEINRQSSRG